MTLLTARGSFTEAYLAQFEADVVSIREIDESQFVERLSEADVIINNASTITSKDLRICVERNFDFSRFVIDQLEQHNPGAHLVHISSMSVLSPHDDSVYDDVLAMTPYAYSKYLAETYGRKSALERVSFVRFSTLFYKNPEKDGLSKLISDAVTTGKITIYNGGEARRNFLPLDIAAQYVEKVSSRDQNNKPFYNLAAPASTSFLEVANILKKHLPSLKIENKALEGGMPILSEFDTAGVDSLGRIDFSIEEHIVDYIRELQA